ncbi:hypothetical protein [Oceanobacillus jeddahense]|uniref:Uncharacterized protein n=1 Tax=Oceanobacillus jeddahense TaxID=1462527 RepID=A0ABY5JVF8_9BACI|nr:hypothetical protein [Oceanobacillus jeddahense]UUI02842.1 hypothetical protein NP439_22875 [Oceanobacillus jeddahense]
MQKQNILTIAMIGKLDLVKKKGVKSIVYPDGACQRKAEIRG